MTSDISRHDEEIKENLLRWQKKPVLREIYKGFYRKIAGYVSSSVRGTIVELGSGIASIKEIIPECICTDIFPHPWVDRVENAYQMSFMNEEVSHIILFDVFHHLEYPGACLKEFNRVLCKGGRVIIFEPYISLLGMIVFGLLHHEAVGLMKDVTWFTPPTWTAQDVRYYSAQGNATRIFFSKKYDEYLSGWKIVARHRMSALSYILSGGYSKPQLYPASLLPVMRKIERILDYLPWLFATRLLVVLEKVYR